MSRNATLRCAAAFLDMQHRAELARRVDEFLTQAALRVLPSAVTVLRSYEALLPASEELGIVRRATDAVALRICNEALFPTRTPLGWWTTELAALSPASFEKVVTAPRCRRADPKVLGNVLALAEVLADPRDTEDRCALVESVVGVLPSAADEPIPAALLCRLLHAAVTTEASARTCHDLELRVAAVLEQATAGDLLGVALYGSGECVRNTDTVRRVIAAFVEQHAAASTESGRSRRRASLFGGRAAEVDSGVMEKVARTVDELVAELATEESLAISIFVGVAGAVPKEARGSSNWSRFLM